MGNQPSQEQINNKSAFGNIKRPNVTPYIPGSNEDFQGYDNNVQVTENRNTDNDDFGYTTMNGYKLQFDPDAMFFITNMQISDAEGRFTQQELAQIKREFDKNSKDQIIGKRKLIEFFKITEVAETYLANELFAIIKNSNKLNSPIDYQKFISFIAVLVKGAKIEKLLLIFSIFGKGLPTGDGQKSQNKEKKLDSSIDSDSEEEKKNLKYGQNEYGSSDDEEIDEDKEYQPRVSKEDMKLHISGTILSMANINFDNRAIENLKNEICKCDEQLIEDALELMVDEIYESHALTDKDGGLSFEEWGKWFTSLEGMNEMLMSNQYNIINHGTVGSQRASQTSDHNNFQSGRYDSKLNVMKKISTIRESNGA